MHLEVVAQLTLAVVPQTETKAPFVRLLSVRIYGCHNYLLLANIWGGGAGAIYTLALKPFVGHRGASLKCCCYWLQRVRRGGTPLFYFPGTLIMGWRKCLGAWTECPVLYEVALTYRPSFCICCVSTSCISLSLRGSLSDRVVIINMIGEIQEALNRYIS